MDKAEVPLGNGREKRFGALELESAEGRQRLKSTSCAVTLKELQMGLKPTGALCHIQTHSRYIVEGEF